MNTGGSFVIEDGKRVLTQHTRSQATMSHRDKIAAANPKPPANTKKVKVGDN
jgi:hypothetical protein